MNNNMTLIEHCGWNALIEMPCATEFNHVLVLTIIGNAYTALLAFPAIMFSSYLICSFDWNVSDVIRNVLTGCRE